MESVVHWFAENMPSFLTPEAAVFLISMVPILELRGGLLLATVLKIPMLQAVFACVIGNIIPIPFILLFIRQIFKWLKKTKLFCPLIEKLEKRAMGKSDKIKIYEFWGLVLFVGLPLPGTGAWTGALMASLLEVVL
ncbi:MAG: COG2426 family protein, partial [Blautia marasmi]